MGARTLFALWLAVLIVSGCAVEPDGNYSLYLVRHSEKQTDAGADPGLTAAGHDRSKQLAKWLEDKGIRKIWTSDYQRTRDTAEPLASKLGLELALYDPRELPALANELFEDRNNALVVGHSNTTPELTRLLCRCEISDMDDSEYELLYVVSVSDDETKVEMQNQSTFSRR